MYAHWFRNIRVRRISHHFLAFFNFALAEVLSGSANFVYIAGQELRRHKKIQKTGAGNLNFGADQSRTDARKMSGEIPGQGPRRVAND